MRRKVNIVLAVSFVTVFFLACSSSRKITIHDAVGLPDSRADITVKVESRAILFHPDVSGVKVAAFDMEGNVVSEKVTNDDGEARLKVELPEEPGVYSAPVEIFEEGRGKIRKEARIFVFRKDQKFIVTDIDGTISATAEYLIPFISVDKIKPMEGAVKALTDLSRDYGIIYLTARDDALLNKTKHWLEVKGFPPGPVICRDIGLDSFSAEGFKQKKIEELKKTFGSIEYGVGDTQSDVNAYNAAGLKAIYISRKKKVEGALNVTGWDEILRAIVEDKQE